MGRRRYKEEEDYYQSIDVYWLNKYKFFSGEVIGNLRGIRVHVLTDKDNPYVIFKYSLINQATKEKNDYEYKVLLDKTPCNYGGWRYWFICPLNNCRRRVGKLYLAGKYFGCRHCHDLTYASQNVNRKHGYYYLFKTIEIGEKIREMENDIKRKYYAGKPTKKMKKILQLYQRIPK